MLRESKCLGTTHPEINLQIPAPAELPVSDLKCDRHLVPLVQVLVEAFSRMRIQLDVVGPGQGDEEDEEEGGKEAGGGARSESHDC